MFLLPENINETISFIADLGGTLSVVYVIYAFLRNSFRRGWLAKLQGWFLTKYLNKILAGGGEVFEQIQIENIKKKLLSKKPELVQVGIHEMQYFNGNSSKALTKTLKIALCNWNDWTSHIHQELIKELARRT